LVGHAYLTLTISYHATVIGISGTGFLERVLQSSPLQAAMAQRRTDMKIYLLMMLMVALFTAIRLTSAQKQQSNSLPQ
jgi:hypothetical protein